MEIFFHPLTKRLVLLSVEMFQDQAQSACFSSSGEIIVVGMTSGKWMVIDSQTREVYAINQDGSEPIQTVKFSPNDKLLALGSRDNLIYIYQVGEGCRKFNRMGRCMVSVEFLRDNDLNASLTSLLLHANSKRAIHDGKGTITGFFTLR